jgi:hypothetical protein
VVIAYKLDRLDRSLAHLAQFIGELQTHGVALICPSQGSDTTDANPAAKLLLGILCAVAEFEREIIRERVNAGIAAARGRGVKLGRPSTLKRHEKEVALDGGRVGGVCDRQKAWNSVVVRAQGYDEVESVGLFPPGFFISPFGLKVCLPFSPSRSHSRNRRTPQT